MATRQIVIQLLNVIETLAAENAALRGEIQQLRDENARLTGRSGKPDIKPPAPPLPPPADHSSEAERRTRTPCGKPKKNATLTVTHEERCVVDPATLPPDAVRHGTTDSIVQRLRINVEEGHWADEAEAIHQTGLATGSWVATDQTSPRVDGQNELCHVVGNDLFPSCHTRPGGTRQDLLAVI